MNVFSENRFFLIFSMFQDIEVRSNAASVLLLTELSGGISLKIPDLRAAHSNQE